MEWNATGELGMNMTKEVKKYEQYKQTFVFSAVFLCVVLFAAVLLRESLKKIHFPYTVLLFVFGTILGVLDYRFKSFREFTSLAKQDIIIHLLLPVIVFEDAFGMNPHMFVAAISQCMILAVPGFIFCATLNAAFAKTVLSLYQWDWPVCILFGAILAATDASAVLDLLKEHGVSPSLTTIIEGESLLNSGIVLAVSHTLLKLIVGASMEVQDIILHVFKTCLGAVGFGYVIAMGTVALLRKAENDTDMEVTFTFCITYITYFVSEIYLNISGILAVLVLGVSVSNYKSNINYEEEETTVHQFWQTLKFWAYSLIFAIVGLMITSKALRSLAASDIGFIIATYFATFVFRACMITVLAPFLRGTGYGFSWTYGVVLTWGGMRGAVGLAIALFSRFVVSELENKLLTVVSGVIVLTLIFNASTMHFLLKLLGIGQITEKNVESMAHTVTLLKDAVSTTEKVARMNKYLAGVDWAWVHQVTQIVNPYEGKSGAHTTMWKRAFDSFRGHCKECKAEIRIEPNTEEQERMQSESRLLILRALEASVANQHSGYGILRRTLSHLNTCIENALDIPNKYLLAEDVKHKFLSTKYYVKFLKMHMMRVLQKLNIKNRQTRVQMLLRIQEEDSTSFSKWCVGIFLGRRFEPSVYWALLINVVPIASELAAVLSRHRYSTSKKHMEGEIVLFEIIHAVLAMVYVFDTVVRIGAFGSKRFFRSKGNLLDFFVTVVAVVQIIYGIILISAYRYSYSEEALYVLLSLGTVRLIRLFKLTLTGMFINILDQLCSDFYNAYDLAIGFIVANEKIAKSAHKIVEYEKCADFARFTSENNMLEMLNYLDDLETEHPSVVCAWRTHRAAVYILRNMKAIIEEMVDIYMLDEGDAEQLHEEIALKLNNTLTAPRYLSVKNGVRNTMKAVPWIQDDLILNKIMEKYSICSFAAGETIQVSEKEHPDIKVIYKGIVQVSGNNSGEKSGTLPNSDSVWFFYRIGDFTAQLVAPGTLGLLGYLLRSPSVTSATCSKDCQLILIEFETLSQIEMEYENFSFDMWRPLALQIARSILKKEEYYENWSEEKLKIHLEEGIMPNLDGKVEFDVHPVIADMVVIQGTLKDKNTGDVYVGPAYISNSVRSLVVMDDPKERPRVVMVLLREEKYHARSIMNWLKIDEITYTGLCLVHGISKANRYSSQNLNQEFENHRKSFIHTLGKLFMPKDERILSSDTP